MPTASIQVPSGISYTDPVSGVELKGGQPFKMIFVASENAIKEGVTAPTMRQFAAVHAFDSTINALQRLMSPKTQRRVAIKGELASVEPTITKSFGLTKPERIIARETALNQYNKYKGTKQGGYTDEQLMELGDWLNEEGIVVRPRDRYWHPDSERMDGGFGHTGL